MEQRQMNYNVESFADLQILRYEVGGFDSLTPRQKRLVYYLQEAALCGRDILFDQNGLYNLRIRRMLETLYLYFSGKAEQPAEFAALEVYLKRVWFSSGIHHHYSTDKFFPDFSPEFLRKALAECPEAWRPMAKGAPLESWCAELFPVIFDPKVCPKRVNQVDGEDLLLTSSCNYYYNVSQSEAEAFYDRQKEAEESDCPVSYGLNSRLVKDENGRLREEKWMVGGMYSPAIERIVYWLERAKEEAETEQQRHVIELLVAYYQTGDLSTFDEYSIAWLEDTAPRVDFVNGFIETYGDPLGMKASWESIVNLKDLEATRRTEIISSHAQWFEDNSPVEARFKKKEVRGVSAKVIEAAILAGDLYPSSAIGINLPNSNWIRARFGSKSVTIGNLTKAYSEAAKGNGFWKEFVLDEEVIARLEKYSYVTDDLHTDLHECLGHGSGKLLPGVDPDGLKSYGAAIEEARADLFGLYYIADPMMISLGLLPDGEAYKAQYYSYLMNGLMTQLVRIEPGATIEEAHMRNRQLIAKWVMEKGQKDHVLEFVHRNGGKTYLQVNDYEALRGLFGTLLAEVQRIRSTGDYAAARALVEQYGVQIDPDLHREVKLRYEKLHLSPYKGFINPRYIPVYAADGVTLADVRVDYSEGYAEQMLRYSRDYSFLI
ncbi:MAG: dipeptidyl-peptidase 3 family protein [Bacteroidaceae bacterium]|jgi:dipeptidyl-peptidase-3